jgi:hypothetical protein
MHVRAVTAGADGVQLMLVYNVFYPDIFFSRRDFYLQPVGFAQYRFLFIVHTDLL